MNRVDRWLLVHDRLITRVQWVAAGTAIAVLMALLIVPR